MDALTCIAGRYRIIARLGTGGMSVVWRAHDDVLDRPVAVKLLALGGSVDAAARARIQAEAQAAAALAHPNVAAVHDYGESTGPSGEPVPYVVMELVDGPTLTEVLADGPVAAAEALQICADVAAGLAAAHARGLVHRDVKPGNIIVTAERAKLVDFGIAASIGELDVADENGIVLGTPAYVAPERLDDGVVVAGSDVYALGLLLYRMLAGEPPWSTESTVALLEAHAYLPPRPLPPIEGVPAQVNDLCHRCLAKDPADRPTAAQAAAVLVEALRTVAAASAGPAATSPGPAATASGPAAGARSGDGGRTGQRRRGRLAGIAAGLAVVAALAAAVVVLAPDPPRGGAGQPGAAPGSGAPAVPLPGASPAGDLPSSGSGANTPQAGPASGFTGSGGDQPGPGGGDRPPGGGAPPGGPTASSTPTAPVTPARRPVQTTGGSVVVECAGDLARLTDLAPAAGYESQAVQAGPGPVVHVKFRSGPDMVSVQGRCVDGVPDVTVR